MRSCAIVWRTCRTPSSARPSTAGCSLHLRRWLDADLGIGVGPEGVSKAGANVGDIEKTVEVTCERVVLMQIIRGDLAPEMALAMGQVDVDDLGQLMVQDGLQARASSLRHSTRWMRSVRRRRGGEEAPTEAPAEARCRRRR